MSYFPEMFKSSGGMKAFLLHVNNFGEVVVFSLTKDGAIDGMAKGDADKAIGEALRQVDPFAACVSAARKYRDFRVDGKVYLEPTAIHSYEGSWAKTVERMNRKGVRATELQAYWRVYSDMFNLTHIEWDCDAKKYVLTKHGMETDAKAEEYKARRKRGGDRADTPTPPAS